MGPSMQSADLGQRLVAQGFTYAGDEPGMAADPLALREDMPAPAASGHPGCGASPERKAVPGWPAQGTTCQQSLSMH